MAEKLPWVYDRKGKRWRRGGKFAKAPKASQLRTDKSGHFLDSAGKKVPASAVVLPKKKQTSRSKPAPKKKPKPAPSRKPAKKAPARPKARPKAKTPPVRPTTKPKAKPKAKSKRTPILETFARPLPPSQPGSRERARRQIQQIRGGQIVKREFLSSTWSNKAKPKNAADVLEHMIERAADHGPFDPQDVIVYEHGLKFLGHERLTDEIKERLAEHIPPGGKIKFADTKVGTEVYIFLGATPKVMHQTTSSIQKAAGNIEAVYQELLDYWGDLDWYVWAETAESLYD